MGKLKYWLSGYHYTTRNLIRYGDFKDLKKIAKLENRKLRRQRRIERLVVYPVPGSISGMGQLMVLM